jgi:deoxyribose-phosphate aldolase
MNTETIVKKVNAILDEANVQARTGRTLPGLGALPDGDGIARVIDHTLLKPEATERDIELLCYEGKLYGFASVCVNSVFVPLAAELLRATHVKVCTVVGFPLGASLPQVKTYEALEAIRAGAQEVDMVLHIGALKIRDLVAVYEDISDVATACHEHNALCKVILETALLTDEEIVMACQIARRAGADFVKTSTGFGGGGATTEHVQLMRQIVGEGMGVKASGGVRTLADAQAMIAAGANRIGASAGVAIVRSENGSSAAGAASDY